ncbi:MAG: hypothetical protein IJO99_02220 [Ruminococcus sp.]|nr:hypothetical protein [Ruminococcus sp.]
MKNIAEGTKKQLFYCALTLLVALTTMSDFYFDSDQNGLKTLQASCAVLPIVIFVFTGISAFRLESTDIYIKVISVAVIIFIMCFFTYIKKDFVIYFGVSVAVALFLGLKIGRALRRLKKK